MANTTIALKKSGTTSSKPVSLANGEIAINYADGILYYKHANGTIASISGSGASINYFGTVDANGTLLISDTSGDTVSIYPGDGVTIVGDAVNDRMYVNATPIGASANGWANTLSTSDRAISNAAANSANAYTVTVGTAGNNYAIQVSAASNTWANTKVSSVSGTSGRITSSGGTTPAIDLATAGAGAASYSSGISALTVDAYGRVTSVTGSAGYVTSSGVTSVSGTGTVSGLTLSGTVTTTGSLTLGGTLSASVIDNMTDEHRLFNNMGDNHSTRTAFDATNPSYNFGWRFVQGSTNGPGVNGASQYYHEYVGLGNEYPATGAGSYGMQIAIPRNVTTPYIAIRYNENNTLGAWQKISAGYSDDAGTVGGISGTAFAAGNNYTNAVGTAGNNYTNAVGTAGNNYTNAVGAAGNNYTNAVGAAGNNYTNAVGAASNTWANTLSTSDRAISNAAANSANAYTVTVGTAGNNYTNAVGTAGNNYTNAVGAASNTWANTKVSSVSGTSGRITSSGGTTPAIDLATSGVTATTYGGSTNIPTFAVDTYGRITSASNVAVSSGGVTITNESASASTFYPVFTLTTTGTMSTANVDTVDLKYVPSTGTLSSLIFNSTSDITMKTDIEELDGVELIKDINPVGFKWKRSGIKSYGVIAQDLEKVLPELVQTDDEGLKSVSYIPMIAMLVDVVKKQQKEIQEIKELLNRKKE